MNGQLAAATLALGLLAAPAATVRAQEAFAFDRPGIGFGTTVLQPGEVALEQGLPDFGRDSADGLQTTSLVANSLLLRRVKSIAE